MSTCWRRHRERAYNFGKGGHTSLHGRTVNRAVRGKSLCDS